MIEINELRVTPDSKYLVIDVSVIDVPYYTNIYIDSLYLDIYSKPEDFISPTPSSKAIKLWDISELNVEDSPKRIRKVVDIDTLENQLFFVYAIAGGSPSEDTPCGWKNPLTLGVTYDKVRVYSQSMGILKTLSDCDINKEAINAILKIQAFELSIKTGNYIQAIKYWNEFFKSSKVSITKNCGCHGS